ncbi:uncharacterized protein Tco025E_03173 [Trypanosoma conorhini]|uniref:Uncharacterized protein n=1 Tax=Trypanosoma conorhini TaxID=83891 RepID=A0A3R7L902_9TRYP|nr:uncharacterized protein Tco025E_03173 [Trypanosoma conorhini]RNF22241.1 hypothetical protein Tco025E_03173 [Trypanosoma conorhini]
MEVAVAPLPFLASAAARVPQQWSLLAHHRNSRQPPSQRHAETSSTSTCGAAEGTCDGGSVGAPAGAVAALPRGLTDAHEEETPPRSPTVSTVSVLWRAPPSEPPDGRGGAGGGGRGSAASAAVERDGGGNRLLTFLQRRASPCQHAEAEGALGAFAAVLAQVRAVHLSRCPLCAPRRPPNWWTPAREEKRCRETSHGRRNRSIKKLRQHKYDDGGEDADNEEDSELDTLGRPRTPIDGAMGDGERPGLLLEKWDTRNCLQTSLTVAHQRLRLEAMAFLEHVYSRREHLHATRPAMYAVRPDAHLLRQECAALGGIVLVEALLLGL